MAVFSSNGIYFAIDDTLGGSLQELTGLTNVDGLPGDLEHAQSTAIGDTVQQSHPTVYNVEFTIEGWYDNTATTGTGEILPVLWAAQQAAPTSTASFVYGPEGNTTGMPDRTGEAKIASYVESTPVNDMVKFRARFKAQSITIGTFA